ncbi:major capsid protein [Bacillus phage vB_BanS-Thrax1]|nr:major capsid protein [Bacillus phage vB_BanS-Thrax1]
MSKTIVKLAVDLAKGKVENFSKSQSNDALRKAFADLMEFSIEDAKGRVEIPRKVMRKHKVEIFEILEEIVNETLQEGLKSQFDGFAEYRNLAWGDENLFKVPAKNIFRVSLVSDGNGNIRRQRLRDGQEFSVSLDTYAIKIGEDFHRFLAGRVEWGELMGLIAESFQRELTKRIYRAILASYGRYNGTYHMSGNLQEKDLVELAMHIKARTGEDVAVYGTKLALRHLAPAQGTITDAMNDARNKTGFYGLISGIELREIEQSHEYGTDEFAIDNSMLLVLPQSADKMVKVVNEGDAIIQDQQAGISSDMMQEYFIANRFGVAVITTKVYGFIKLADTDLTPAPPVKQGLEVY